MSHFTTIKTIIKEQSILEESLRNLHYQYAVGERLLIRGYANNTAYGQVVINTQSDYDIGFQRQGDASFSVCADWWGVERNTPIKQEQFLRKLNKTYAYQSIKRQINLQGYYLEQEETLQNGEIRLVVCQPI
jgi:hypothetical protein